MNDLMIHVERIVRPVRAMELRKLRMRRELLAHLQAAYEQELAAKVDAATAIQSATRRLGDPVELTRQLQRTVPWAERLLLASVPVPHSFERWEVEGAKKLYGTSAMTMLHGSILAGAAGLLSGVPLYLVAPVKDALTYSGVVLAHPAAFLWGLFILWNAILIVSYRFVVAEADPQAPPNLVSTLKRGAALIALQIAFVAVAMGSAYDRLPTLVELSGSIALTIAFSIGSILIARRVADLRRPYSEWLTLELAE